LAGLVRGALDFLLVALRDAHPGVKNTTAWAIGRIFEFVHGQSGVQPPLLGPQTLPPVVAALLEALRDAPHVAEKACYAISQLAAGFRPQGQTSSLSPFFKDVVQGLLETAARPVEGADGTRLHTQAFEAINEVVESAAPDTLPLVSQLVPVVVAKLAETLGPAGPGHERQTELQGLLCGVVQVVVQKLGGAGDAARAEVNKYADGVMDVLLKVFASRPGTVHEEAMLAVVSEGLICVSFFGVCVCVCVCVVIVRCIIGRILPG
jgi:importin subunit beta-1